MQSEISDYQKALQKVSSQPTCSHALKSYLSAATNRDCIDVVLELEYTLEQVRAGIDTHLMRISDIQNSQEFR